MADFLDARWATAVEHLKSRGCVSFLRAGNEQGSLCATIGVLPDEKYMAVNLLGDFAGIQCPNCRTQVRWLSNKLRCLKCNPLETFTIHWIAEFFFRVEAATEEEALKLGDRKTYDDLQLSDKVEHYGHKVSIVR